MLSHGKHDIIKDVAGIKYPLKIVLTIEEDTVIVITKWTPAAPIRALSIFDMALFMCNLSSFECHCYHSFNLTSNVPRGTFSAR